MMFYLFVVTLTLRPLAATIPNFWRMIWEFRIVTIVMVTPIEEDGSSSCAVYWPSLHVREWYGDVCCECVAVVKGNGFTCRRIKAKKVRSIF